MRTRLLLISIMMLVVQTISPQIVINELMQSNIDCIMDDLNEFPDSWVELRNTGSIAVSLKDYRLGDGDKADKAWQLPDKMVAPGMYALVYCDKEATGMHTHFRLESGKGCDVYLFKDGEVVDKVTGLAKQPAPNIAYGRKSDGSNDWGYQATPTPNAANCGEVYDQILGDPVFSEQGRVITGGQSLLLALSLPEGAPESAEIRMTYDGTEPTRISPKYTTPISISATRIIRAKLFCDGWLSPRSVVQSYIFHPREQTLPVISIATDGKYLTDSKIGIYVDGNYQSGKRNYEFNWRRPMNIELFETAGEQSVINQLCEARIMGGATRGEPLKSMAFYANKRFGTKRFEYEFFPDQRPGLTDYKSFQLRNAGNDFHYLYMRDAIIQRTMAQHADLDWQAWRPAIVYINGVYKGMLNIRERSNEDNIYTNYDGLEDIDMVENWYELKEGDMENFNRFKAFYNEHEHTLAEYEEWMDCEEFVTLMAMNLYYNNQDFPGNNFVMWRPKHEGGRWRFIAKDTDFGLGLYDSPAGYKTLNWLYNPSYDWNRAWANQYEHTRLFRRLMEDEDFSRMFIDRTAIYMGDFMNEQGTRAVWDPMYEQIKTEYPHHRKLINEWWPNYSDELNKARRWLSQRTDYFYQQLGDYYKLGNPITLSVNKTLTDADKFDITFNEVRLSRGVFEGKFFADREITIEGVAPEGKVITGWNIQTISSAGNSQRQVEGSRCSMLMPVCSALVITALVGEANAIDDVLSPDWTWYKDPGGNSLVLSGVPAGMTVRLFDLRGLLVHSVVSDGSDITLPLTPRQLHILKVGEKAVKL
ncbi:MAG: CotH kinase family protein [Prevotella sp.]|nr:CotH kinase family protein [Prevotella sp.]